MSSFLSSQFSLFFFLLKGPDIIYEILLTSYLLPTYMFYIYWNSGLVYLKSTTEKGNYYQILEA